MMLHVMNHRKCLGKIQTFIILSKNGISLPYILRCVTSLYQVFEESIRNYSGSLLIIIM